MISLLLFHLCYCYPLLTFQTNLVWQTDHRCPPDGSPLSEDSLVADLLFSVSSQIPIIPFVVVCLFWPLIYILRESEIAEHLCIVVPLIVRLKEETGGLACVIYRLKEDERC